MPDRKPLGHCLPGSQADGITFTCYIRQLLTTVYYSTPSILSYIEPHKNVALQCNVPSYSIAIIIKLKGMK